jgi:hypothetical protein
VVDAVDIDGGGNGGTFSLTGNGAGGPAALVFVVVIVDDGTGAALAVPVGRMRIGGRADIRLICAVTNCATANDVQAYQRVY